MYGHDMCTCDVCGASKGVMCEQGYDVMCSCVIFMQGCDANACDLSAWVWYMCLAGYGVSMSDMHAWV